MVLFRNFIGNRGWYRVCWNSNESRVFEKLKIIRNHPIEESRIFLNTEERTKLPSNHDVVVDDGDIKKDRDIGETKNISSMTNPSHDDDFNIIEEGDTDIMTRQEREFRRWKKDLQDLLDHDVPRLLEKCTPWIKPDRNRLIRIKNVERSPDGSLPQGFEDPRDRKVVAEFRLGDMLDYYGSTSTTTDGRLSNSSDTRESIRKRCLLLAGKRYHVKKDIIRMSVDDAGTREANRNLVHQRIHHLMEAAMDSSLPVDSIPWQMIYERVNQRGPLKAYPFPKQWLDRATELRGGMIMNHQESIDKKQPFVSSDTTTSSSPTNPTGN